MAGLSRLEWRLELRLTEPGSVFERRLSPAERLKRRLSPAEMLERLDRMTEEIDDSSKASSLACTHLCVGPSQFSASRLSTNHLLSMSWAFSSFLAMFHAYGWNRIG